MRVAILTSSRADYGIYQPLLRRLEKDPFFEMEVVAFGTHLSEFHGYTLRNIQEDGFKVARQLESLVLGDSAEAVSSAMGLTTLKFSSYWASAKDTYDLIFCLGDRYEMFAAVSAGIPFNLNFAHIHGGEETLGAIDNVFRHSITQMADYHFTTTGQYKERVLQLLGENNAIENKVYNVGSLSLDNIKDVELLDTSEFLQQYGIDLNKPTILFTFHPETVTPQVNEAYIEKIIDALEQLEEYQIVITMPNADTKGSVIRHVLKDFINQNPDRAFGVESFGTKGYFSCMKYADMLMGNSSSGIIEAASFDKYVINLGDRQKGRAAGENVLHAGITTEKIIEAVKEIEQLPEPSGENIYWNGGASEQIINILKSEFRS